MSDRLIEYFAREAREYLDQLEEMLRETGVPSGEEILRLARGVRGSAQMALADGIALAAEKLEDAAASLVSGDISWNEEVRAMAAATVHDLKELVSALSRWGPAEDERARATRDRWEAVGIGAESMDNRVVIPIESLFYDDDGPHILHGPQSAAPAGATEVVPVEQLLFRGAAALREAISLRPRLEALARTGGSSDAALDDLIEEVFDLVRLGMDRDDPSA